jgi:hypothetical protein
LKPVKLSVVRDKKQQAERNRMHRALLLDARDARKRYPDCDGYVLVVYPKAIGTVYRRSWERSARQHDDAMRRSFEGI